jgi:hypothetical protein
MIDFVLPVSLAIAIAVVILWITFDSASISAFGVSRGVLSNINVDDYDLIRCNSTWILSDRNTDNYIGSTGPTILFKYYSRNGGVICRFSKLAKTINKKLEKLKDLPAVPLGDFTED